MLKKNELISLLISLQERNKILSRLENLQYFAQTKYRKNTYIRTARFKFGKYKTLSKYYFELYTTSQNKAVVPYSILKIFIVKLLNR